jgi:hypothetical protein
VEQGFKNLRVQRTIPQQPLYCLNYYYQKFLTTLLVKARRNLGSYPRTFGMSNLGSLQSCDHRPPTASAAFSFCAMSDRNHTNSPQVDLISWHLPSEGNEPHVSIKCGESFVHLQGSLTGVSVEFENADGGRKCGKVLYILL